MYNGGFVNKREFSLPLERLSLEQKQIRLLPLEGQYLIVGAPGTGKSVLALLRAKILHEEQKEYIFLAFNQPLIKANSQLFGEGLHQQQWQSWFMKIYKELLDKRNVPYKGSNKLDFDWVQILDEAKKLQIDNSPKPYVIIDEGQDMPVSFYEFLMEVGYENFFVVADQNQRIQEQSNSSVLDLQTVLALDRNQVYELTDNYRNNYAIARFVQTFYHDPASPKPKLPATGTDSSKPVLYYREHVDSASIIWRRLILTNQNFPSDLVAVITASKASRNDCYQAFQAEITSQGIDIPTVCYEQSADARSLDFTQGGIIFMTAHACKGLEFDKVFLWDINEYKASQDHINQLKKLLYVATSRAKKQLVLFKKKQNSIVATILTNDADILQTKIIKGAQR